MTLSTSYICTSIVIILYLFTKFNMKFCVIQ